MTHPLLTRSDQFFKSLKPSDKIALLHDTDPDGTTSGKIITQALHQLGHTIHLNLIITNKGHTVNDDIIAVLKENSITILITNDKTVDGGPEQIKKVEEFAKVYAFDHHIIEHNITSPKTILLKPQLIDSSIPPAQYCSAKLSYDILNRITNLDNVDWVAAIGIIGDVAYPAWEDFLHTVYEKYSLPIESHQKTILGTISNLIFFAEALGEAEQCFDIMLNSQNPFDALKQLKQYEIVQQEVDYYVANVHNLAQIHEEQKLIILEVKNAAKIKSIVSNNIAILNPHHTVIVIQQIGSTMTISARRNDATLNMNVLLKKALADLQGNAGGHVPAAGASVGIEDYPQFKSNIIRIINTLQEQAL